jgi:hypothetical protein
VARSASYRPFCLSLSVAGQVYLRVPMVHGTKPDNLKDRNHDT